MTIDWQELTEAVNNIKGTEYANDTVMLRDIYNKTGNVQKMAESIGVSPDSVARRMNRKHIPRLVKAHEGCMRARMRILAIPECERGAMTAKEIAAAASCSLSAAYAYIHAVLDEGKL